MLRHKLKPLWAAFSPRLARVSRLRPVLRYGRVSQFAQTLARTMRTRMRETTFMAARWIGLARPHPQHPLRATRSNKNRHPLDRTLRGVGAACVLGAGLLFNWALLSEASGHGLWDRQISSLAPRAVAPDRSEGIASASIAVNEEELRLLAATAWGEARSEGEDGMRAVAHVMVNRVGDRFGNDLETVIRAPWQFSAWNAGDPNRPLVQNPERYARGGENKTTWETAQQVAREVLSGQSVDPTNGALFYHTRAISPWWSHYGEGRQVIGAHVFYRDVPVRYGAERPRGRVTQTAARAPENAAIEQNAPAQQQGRRAGRVNGVIQYAPVEEPVQTPVQVDVADALAPAAVNRAPDPAFAAAMAQLPTSASY